MRRMRETLVHFRESGEETNGKWNGSIETIGGKVAVGIEQYLTGEIFGATQEGVATITKTETSRRFQAYNN